MHSADTVAYCYIRYGAVERSVRTVTMTVTARRWSSLPSSTWTSYKWRPRRLHGHIQTDTPNQTHTHVRTLSFCSTGAISGVAPRWACPLKKKAQRQLQQVLSHMSVLSHDQDHTKGNSHSHRWHWTGKKWPNKPHFSWSTDSFLRERTSLPLCWLSEYSVNTCSSHGTQMQTHTDDGRKYIGCIAEVEKVIHWHNTRTFAYTQLNSHVCMCVIMSGSSNAAAPYTQTRHITNCGTSAMWLWWWW